MRPLNANKIRKHLNTIDPVLSENQKNTCVSRLAFETNIKNQLEVIQLDYNTLNSYKGVIKFTEGMKNLTFQGSLFKDKGKSLKFKKKKKKSMSCVDAMK